MTFRTILVERENHVVKIIMNRPEKLNAFNDDVLRELKQVLDEVDRDNEVRVIVLTGTGKSFCAGAEFKIAEARENKLALEEAEDMGDAFSAMREGRLLHMMLSEVVLNLQRLNKPTIAMLKGDVVGGGMDLALACDIRIGAEGTRFSSAEVKMGVPPAGGAFWLLPRIIGMGNALELLLTGDFCTADDAYRLGMLNKLVPEETLKQETDSLANKLAQGAPIAIRLTKLMTYRALEMDLETALVFGSACAPIGVKSEDYIEAISAWAEKRRAVFKGK